MAGGRPAKPTKLKVLHGDRKDRINTAEPAPLGAVTAPAHLSEAARDVWAEIAPDRIRQGVLTAWDVDAFATLCEALAMLRRADWSQAMVLAKPGQESPMSKLRQLVAISATLGGKFGWTPADRQKLIVGEARRDPGADLLTG